MDTEKANANQDSGFWFRAKVPALTITLSQLLSVMDELMSRCGSV